MQFGGFAMDTVTCREQAPVWYRDSHLNTRMIEQYYNYCHQMQSIGKSELCFYGWLVHLYLNNETYSDGTQVISVLEG
jgi:hypothetical protein